MALLAGSPAIDAGNSALVTAPSFAGPPFTDQRGALYARVVDGNGDSIAQVDIGAYEVGLLLGDFDRDKQRTVTDISASMVALTDLSKYQSTNSLFGADLLAVADTNRDTAVTNTDIQGLIVLLANSPGGGGGSLATGAATTAASQAPTVAKVPSAANLAPTIATVPSDPQPSTSTGTTHIKALAAEVPDAAVSVSRRSADRSPSALSFEAPKPPSLKTTLIDQAISTLRQRSHSRQPSAIATSPQLDDLFAAWR